MGKAWLVSSLLLLPLVAQAQQWDFGVYLDGKHIGTHRFTVERDGAEGYHVTSFAEFKVTVLRIPVFRYKHSAVEIWRDGCLQSIDTQTSVNGNLTAVVGRLTASGFNIDVSSSEGEHRETLPACVASFAYWNPEVLQAHGELLNGQTGAYQSVSRTLIGRSDRSSLELKGGDFQIDVSYANDDGRWVALHTTTGDGRTLEYWLETPAKSATRS